MRVTTASRPSIVNTVDPRSYVFAVRDRQRPVRLNGGGPCLKAAVAATTVDSGLSDIRGTIFATAVCGDRSLSGSLESHLVNFKNRSVPLPKPCGAFPCTED